MRRTSFLFLIFLIVIFLIPPIAYGWQGSCSVEIAGPRLLCIGETITLTACGEPPGGSCSWSNTPGLSPLGCKANVTGISNGDFWITVNYSVDNARCYDVAKVTVGGRDADGDGHYAIGSCVQPADDCNDNDPAVHPGATEVCDGKDNNCDGQVDEGCCEDKDGDGHYAISASCPQGNDCNDNDPTIYPGASEICDGKDNNCDGQIDDLCPRLSVPLYKQCASPWGMDIYDHTASTICKKGCALTSAVMVLRYYGVTTGIDGKEVNPRNLNEWLKSQSKGYVGKEWINWDEVARYSGWRVAYAGAVHGRNDELLNSDLCSRLPVVINVPNHFVVATGAMCANNETTWTINDPGRNITTLQGYGNTYLGLRRFR